MIPRTAAIADSRVSTGLTAPGSRRSDWWSIPAAPVAQDRHPADRPLGGQASGADRLAAGIAGHDVVAQRVEFVPFQRQRHTLFLHEHRLADAAQVGQAGLVLDGFHGEGRRAHSSSTSAASSR